MTLQQLWLRPPVDARDCVNQGTTDILDVIRVACMGLSSGGTEVRKHTHMLRSAHVRHCEERELTKTFLAFFTPFQSSAAEAADILPLIKSLRSLSRENMIMILAISSPSDPFSVMALETPTM